MKYFLTALLFLNTAHALNYGLDSGYYIYEEFVDNAKIISEKGFLNGIYATHKANVNKNISTEFRIKIAANKISYDGTDHNKTKLITDCFYGLLNSENLFRYSLQSNYHLFAGLGYNRIKNTFLHNNQKHFQTYIYIPFGIEYKNLLVELKYLLSGRNNNYLFDVRVPALTQKHGNGFLLKKTFKIKKKLYAEIYYNYWHIKPSNKLFLMINNNISSIQEPENKTNYFGVRIISQEVI